MLCLAIIKPFGRFNIYLNAYSNHHFIQQLQINFTKCAINLPFFTEISSIIAQVCQHRRFQVKAIQACFLLTCTPYNNKWTHKTQSRMREKKKTVEKSNKSNYACAGRTRVREMGSVYKCKTIIKAKLSNKSFNEVGRE